jgi:hypothetical protein
MSQISEEYRLVVEESLDVSIPHDDGHDARSQFWWFRLAVHSIPVTLLIVTSLVTEPVSVVPLTEIIVDGITFLEFRLTISSVKETVGIIALWITSPIEEPFPTSRDTTVPPRVEPKGAVPSIKVTGVLITFLVTVHVVGLFRAVVSLTFPPCLFQVLEDLILIRFLRVWEKTKE